MKPKGLTGGQRVGLGCLALGAAVVAVLCFGLYFWLKATYP